MKIPTLLLLVAIKCLLSVGLNAEEGEKKITTEEAQSLDEFLNGKKSEGLLTEEECKKIDTLSSEIYTNRQYVERDGEWYKISEEDENLLIKGSKYGNGKAEIALVLLYKYRKDSEKLEKVEKPVIDELIRKGEYSGAFWHAICLFEDEKLSEKIRKYGWITAKNLFVEKKLDGTYRDIEKILPFLIDDKDPVIVRDWLRYEPMSIKRPSFDVTDETLAYDLIKQMKQASPNYGSYWDGRMHESSFYKNMPAAFKSYKRGAMFGDRHCIHKVVEFIEEGKGVVPSTTEELIWRYAAQALEADPNREWGILNKRKISLIESSLSSSQVSLEPFRISANKLADEINKSSSEGKKTKPSKESACSLGTGFIISGDGIILTACHVIKDCKKISVNQADGSLPARILAKDEENDIAILKVDGLASKTYLPFSKAEPKQGDKISTFGFPHSNIEGRDCKFSSGEISSLIGLGSDKRYLRLNLQISPGNSGGPLLDASNHIIGILTAKLDAIKMFEETGDLPTGVSYAVKNELILRLLNTSGLSKKISFNESANKPSESIVLISAE